MENVIEVMFQIVKLNFGGEIFKDMKRMMRNLNRILGWVVSIQDRKYSEFQGIWVDQLVTQDKHQVSETETQAIIQFLSG